LQKKTDEEIVQGLQECDIPPLSNLDKPEEYDSYDYVLRMRIDRLKQSAIIEMDKQIAEKQEEIEQLESQTGSSLWLSDLQEFLEAWKKYTEHRIAESTSIAKSESSKSKPTPKKRPVVRK
jgi:hypothetical protein